MRTDRVKVFETWDIDSMESLINEWFEANPNFYIRTVKINQEKDDSWYAYVTYCVLELEDEE